MITHNKLDKSFGPVGAFAGITVFVAGLCAIWFSGFAIVLIVIGAFVGFSFSGVEIDSEQKRVRFLNILFGIFKSGMWMKIKPDMKIGIRKSNQTWRSYSGGNRRLDIPSCDYRLILFDSLGKKLMPLKKLADLDTAKEELELICSQMELSKL